MEGSCKLPSLSAGLIKNTRSPTLKFGGLPRHSNLSVSSGLSAHTVWPVPKPLTFNTPAPLHTPGDMTGSVGSLPYSKKNEDSVAGRLGSQTEQKAAFDPSPSLFVLPSWPAESY